MVLSFKSAIDTLDISAENRGNASRKTLISQNFLGGAWPALDLLRGISPLAPYLLLDGHSEIPG